ncbi:hypothetical protein [Celeribacter naphthalenivorans]|uniref:hypothetical protein n=1 Tax=Celeribacter naphthalenivorans TaxID=1614694 RepID=UPI001CF957EB|nr:hypothetical protein [Celeribacter naphthalenivorans]
MSTSGFQTLRYVSLVAVLALAQIFFVSERGQAMSQPQRIIQFTCSAEQTTEVSTCDWAREALEHVLPNGFALTDQPAQARLDVSLRETPLGIVMSMNYAPADGGGISETRELSIMDRVGGNTAGLYTRFFERSFASLFE